MIHCRRFNTNKNLLISADWKGECPRSNCISSLFQGIDGNLRKFSLTVFKLTRNVIKNIPFV